MSAAQQQKTELWSEDKHGYRFVELPKSVSADGVLVRELSGSHCGMCMEDGITNMERAYRCAFYGRVRKDAEGELVPFYETMDKCRETPWRIIQRVANAVTELSELSVSPQDREGN